MLALIENLPKCRPAAMFHVACNADRRTFADLAHRVRELQQAGFRSAWDLENGSRPALRTLLGDRDFDLLFHTRPPGKLSTVRQDIPNVRPYARGSLQRIEASRSSSVTWRQLDGIFLQDRFAKSSLAPRTSRRRTWCKLAALRNTSALPITVSLAFKIGALLK